MEPIRQCLRCGNPSSRRRALVAARDFHTADVGRVEETCPLGDRVSELGPEADERVPEAWRYLLTRVDAG